MSESGTTTLTAESTVVPRETERPAEPPVGGAFLFAPVVGDVFSRERFSEEQREIERMVRDFARERIAPRREELSSHDRELSVGLMREVGELGLTGIDIPEQPPAPRDR